MPEEINNEKKNIADNQFSDKENTNDIFMQSDIVNQINYNQQSNMTISAYSVITQSFSTVKINISNNQKELEE